MRAVRAAQTIAVTIAGGDDRLDARDHLTEDDWHTLTSRKELLGIGPPSA
jgi:hypothetical protein